MQIFGGESHLKKNKLPNFSHLIFFGNLICLDQVADREDTAGKSL